MEGPTGGIRSARPCHSARRPGPTGSPERLATTVRFCLRAPRAMKVCVWTTTARGSTERVEPLSISAKTGITSPVMRSGRASVSPPAALTLARLPIQPLPTATWCVPLAVDLGREGDKAMVTVPGSSNLLPSSRLRSLNKVKERDINRSLCANHRPCGASKPRPAKGGPGAGPSFLVSFNDQ